MERFFGISRDASGTTIKYENGSAKDDGNQIEHTSCDPCRVDWLI